MSHETLAATSTEPRTGTYDLKGYLLEVCDCEVICPCWVGEDPDNGTCQGTVAWRIDDGHADGVDVSGLTFAVLANIPGNILQGNWKVLAVVDDKATQDQQDAILKVFTGQLGGPMADIAQLLGEVVGIERATVTAEVEGGNGTLRLGNLVAATMEPYQGMTGKSTTLNDTIFSTIPGAPAYVSKASSYKRNTQQYGITNVDIQGHNAVGGAFHVAN